MSLDGADVIEALGQVMCKGCPKEEECNDPEGIYGGDGDGQQQMIACLFLKQEAIKNSPTPKHFEAEYWFVQCPFCDEWMDKSDRLSKKRGHVDVECDGCRGMVRVSLTEDGTLKAEPAPRKKKEEPKPEDGRYLKPIKRKE